VHEGLAHPLRRLLSNLSKQETVNGKGTVLMPEELNRPSSAHPCAGVDRMLSEGCRVHRVG